MGASADVIETRITQVIEDQISGIEGIKTIRSTSRDEVSSVNVEFQLDRNIDEAANDVRDRVSRSPRPPASMWSHPSSPRRTRTPDR